MKIFLKFTEPFNSFMLYIYEWYSITNGDEKLNFEEIVRRCQSGETQAFRELFCIIESKAFGTAYLISGKRGLAEDIVQEAFVCCIEQIKTLKSPAAFYVWFYKMKSVLGGRW